MRTPIRQFLFWALLRAAGAAAAGFLTTYIALHYQVPLWLPLLAVIAAAIGGATIGRD